MLDIDWKNVLGPCSNDINGMWQEFLSRYNDAEKRNIPKKKVYVGGQSNYQNLNRKTVSKRNKKCKLWKRYLEEKDSKALLEYKRCRNQLRRLTRKAVKDKEKKIASTVKTNCKVFWKYVNKKTKLREAIPTLTTTSGEMKTTNLQKAETLAQYFSSVFTTEPDWSWLLDANEKNTNDKRLEVNITHDKIKKELEELNPNKSPGPDLMQPRVLKEIRSSLVEPLFLIFNASLTAKKIPDDWKLASVTPIYKRKGDKRTPSSYRPISLTSIASRIMESIVKDSIQEYLSLNNFLSSKQFGFLGGKSTVLQLLTVINDLTKNLDNGCVTDVIFCDFQKAFDTVPHRRLLEVLSHYGIQGPILKWIEDFLSNRKMEVIIEGSKSSKFDVTSGVPQGSVLGPLLFIIYINLLVEKSKTENIYLYADDVKIFKEIHSEDDVESLQHTLDLMYDWTCYSLLKFHPEKCVTMRVNSSRKSSEVEGFYNMDGVKLKKVEIEKDLGVFIDEKLSFDTHINTVVKKANSLVGLLRRSFVYLDKDSFKQLFVAIVRPHLEYGAPVWNPYLKKHITLIERVQRRATKLIPGLSAKPYKERLKILRLPTLEYRRYRGDMIQAYKLTHGLYEDNNNLINLRINERINNATTAHPYTIKKERYAKDVRKYFFSNRICDQWNNLPANVVMSTSLNAFKNKLDKVWKKHDVMFDDEIDLHETTSARRTRYIEISEK